jgi:hypothetical protein
MNVGERVRIQEDQIGDFTDFNCPTAVKLPHKLSGVARGGLESCKGR